MLGLELDPLRAEKRALRTGKGVAWPPLRTMNKSSNFYIFEIHAVFNKILSYYLVPSVSSVALPLKSIQIAYNIALFRTVYE